MDTFFDDFSGIASQARKLFGEFFRYDRAGADDCIRGQNGIFGQKSFRRQPTVFADFNMRRFRV